MPTDDQLRRELECRIHEIIFGEAVYRNLDEWKKAGKPYEINMQRQNDLGWPVFFETKAPARWSLVSRWTTIESAFALIELNWTPAHIVRQTGIRTSFWSEDWAISRLDRVKRVYQVHDPYKHVTFAESPEPGVAICLAILFHLGIETKDLKQIGEVKL